MVENAARDRRPADRAEADTRAEALTLAAQAAIQAHIDAAIHTALTPPAR